MGALYDAAKAAFADGPSGSPTEPPKSDIRALFAMADALIAQGVLGRGNLKTSVRVATTTAGTITTAFENGDTVDGVVLATNDRILIKDQGTTAQNRIAVVQASGTPTRATDADSVSELIGATVYVREGTANAGTAWTCNSTEDTLETLDTDPVTFAQIPGVTALTILSTAITDSTAIGRSLVTSASIAAALTALGFSANVQSLVGAADYAAIKVLLGLDAINTGEIADAAVTFAKMQAVAENVLLGRDGGGSGAPEALTLGTGLEFTGTNSVRRSAITGDVSVPAGSNVAALADEAVTLVKMAHVATARILGRATAEDGDVEALTGSQVKEIAGLGSVNNTSDADKPISTATATALAGKASSATVSALITADAVLQAEINVVKTAFNHRFDGDPKRPGDSPLSFIASIAGGDPEDISPLTAADVTTNARGAEIRLTTARPIIATREMFAMEEGREYRIRGLVARRVGTPDPMGDAIVPAAAWYNHEKIALAGGSATSELLDDPISINLGSYAAFTVIVGLASGGNVEVVAPAGTRYCRPHVEQYGSIPETGLIVLDWDDITDFVVASPDLAGVNDRLVVLEDIDAEQRISDLESAVGNPSKVVYETYADALIGTPADLTIGFVETLGWAALGDGGGARYKRVGSEPSHPGKLSMTLGGTVWFEIIEPILSVAMFGAFPTSTAAQNTTRFQEALDTGAAIASSVFVPAGEYTLAERIGVPTGVKFYGVFRQSILTADEDFPAELDGQFFIHQEDAQDYEIHDLVIDMSDITLAGGVHAIRNERCSNYNIHHCKILSPMICISSSEGCHHYAIYDNDVSTVDVGAGVFAGGLIDNWWDNYDFRIEDNYCDGNDLQPVGILMTGTDSETEPTLQPVMNIKIRGNTVRRTAGTGIQLDGARDEMADLESGWRNVIVTENIIEDNVNNYGIRAYAGFGAIISHNTLRNIADSGIMCLGEGEGPEATIISENILENINLQGNASAALGSAIYLEAGSEYCRVAGNIIRGSTHYRGIHLEPGANNNDVVDNIIEQLGTSGINIQDSGTGNKISRNRGHKTECRVVSGTFDVATTGQRTISVAHGLAVTPTTAECMVCLVRDTAVLDYEIAQLVVAGADATNVTVQCRVATASATGGAVAKVGLHVVADQG